MSLGLKLGNEIKGMEIDWPFRDMFSASWNRKLKSGERVFPILRVC